MLRAGTATNASGALLTEEKPLHTERMYFTQDQQVEKHVAERVGQHIIKLALHIRWATKVETITPSAQRLPRLLQAGPQSRCLATPGTRCIWPGKNGLSLRQGWDLRTQSPLAQGADASGNRGHSALKWIHTAGQQNDPRVRYFKQKTLSGYAKFVWHWLYHSKALKQWSLPLSSQITRCKYDISFTDMISGSLQISFHYTEGENVFIILTISSNTKLQHTKQRKHYVLLNLSVLFSTGTSALCKSEHTIAKSPTSAASVFDEQCFLVLDSSHWKVN